MNGLIIVFSIAIAYWWHFVRETPGERKYREEQERKAENWRKYNMDKYK